MKVWLWLAFAVSVAGAAPKFTCGSCHEQGRVTPNAMARALSRAAQCEILRTQPRLTASIGGYTYTISRNGDKSIYAVSNGTEAITVPLAWAFGLGKAGQTYLYERDGHWFESRVSYYDAVGGLDLTMGARSRAPASLEEAAGRRMDETDARECFGCHATNSVHGARLETASLTPGVQCKRCHGGADAHFEAVQSKSSETAKMQSLKRLSTEETSDFCGQCHRTWSQIAMNGPRGVGNVRFQPYRLANSKCYDAEDPRVRCTACHDPHKAVASDVRAYDGRCTACHAQGAHGVAGVAADKAPRLCPVAKQDCISCHMPKVELPGAHHRFTDHNIRIVKTNEAYPS